MVACNTGWGHAAPHTGDGSKLPHSGSYGLVSLTNGGKSNGAGKNSTRVSGIGFSNMQKTTTNSVGGAPHPHLGHHQNHQNDNNKKSGVVVGIHSHRSSEQVPVDEAAMSIASNDSQQMIIRREVGYSVTYDDESAPTFLQQGPGRLGPSSNNHRADIEAQNPMAMPPHAQ